MQRIRAFLNCLVPKAFELPEQPGLQIIEVLFDIFFQLAINDSR